MIYALVGRPRSGKSYESVVFHIIPAVKAGRKVITNIPLNIEKFRKVFGDLSDLIEVREFRFDDFGQAERPFSKPEDYLCEWRDENGVGPLYVIDEAHLVLPRQCHVEILEFYSMHGHYGIDIVLLTQNLRKVNRDIRDMVETTHQCIKNTHLGTDKTYTKKMYLGNETRGEPVSQTPRNYDKNYFGFYKSHTASSQAVIEAQAQDVKSVKDHWSVKFGKVFIVGGLIYLVGVYFFMFRGDSEEDTAPEPEQAEQVEIAEAKSKSQEREQNPSSFGLLADFQFYISGWSKQLVQTNGQFNSDLSFYRVYVDVYTNETYEFTLEHTDLIKLGYAFKQLSECVYQVKYYDSSRIVTCKYRDENQLDEPEDTSLDVLASVPSVSI
jgi:zona occludens toxin